MNANCGNWPFTRTAESDAMGSEPHCRTAASLASRINILRSGRLLTAVRGSTLILRLRSLQPPFAASAKTGHSQLTQGGHCCRSEAQHDCLQPDRSEFRIALDAEYFEKRALLIDDSEKSANLCDMLNNVSPSFSVSERAEDERPFFAHFHAVPFHYLKRGADMGRKIRFIDDQ